VPRGPSGESGQSELFAGAQKCDDCQSESWNDPRTCGGAQPGRSRHSVCHTETRERRSDLGSIGRVFAQPASADCPARAEGAVAFHVPPQRICRSRRADELWRKPFLVLPARSLVRGQNIQRCAAGRSADRAANTIQSGHQPYYGGRAWNHDPAASLCFRRRGDRVNKRDFITLLGGAGVWPLAGRGQPFLLPAVLGFALAGGEAWAQTWPTRPIRAIVAFSAGGIVDVMARVVFDQLSTQLRQPVVVENRAGAGTAIAAAFVAKSDPDGYTVLVNSSAHTISPSLQPNLTFDPARDFSAVIPLGSSPMCWSFHHLGALKLLVTLLLPREPSQARSILPRPASAAESI